MEDKPMKKNSRSPNFPFMLAINIPGDLKEWIEGLATPEYNKSDIVREALYKMKDKKHGLQRKK